MGAWGCKPFENDDACDFSALIEDLNDESVLVDAFSTVLDAEYIEAPEGSVAIAAGEVVAAIFGHPTPDLPDEVKDYVSMIKINGAQSLRPQMAIDAVERVVAQSELKELWQETADGHLWEMTIADLIHRLKLI